MTEEQLKWLALIIGVVSGALGLPKLIILPIWKWYKAYRIRKPSFRKSVLMSLERLELGLKKNDDFTAALLRERLEGAYNLYVRILGHCPASEKRMLMELFDLYEDSGYNHLNKKYRDEILALPDSPLKEKSA